MSTENTEGKTAMLKAGAAWTGTGLSFWLESIGIKDWGDMAAFLASIYSLFLIAEWLWKKWKGRP